MGGPGSGRTDLAFSTNHPEKIEELLDRMSNGETVTSICAEEGMPSFRSVMEWKASNPDFASRYAHALDMQLEAFAQQQFDIADESSGDIKTLVKKGQEVEVVNWENVKRAELRVKVRQWMLERRKRKEYGLLDPDTEKKSIAADLLELIRVVGQIAHETKPVIGTIQVKEIADANQNQ
jgi:hypothetical protein